MPPATTPELRIVADEATLHAAAARTIADALAGAVAARGTATVVLAGGTTPKGVYEALAGGSDTAVMPWRHVHVFWGDERHVPPDHPDSNFGMAKAALLSRVPIPAGQIHRIAGEDPDPRAAAAHYVHELRAVIGPSDGIPRFDVVLLGLGADGHTASLFPGSPALAPGAPLVTAVWVETMSAHRITMTLPLLNAAHLVLVLVAGAAKAPAVRDVLQPGPSTPWLPARFLQPDGGRLVWVIDRAAAALLEP